MDAPPSLAGSLSGAEEAMENGYTHSSIQPSSSSTSMLPPSNTAEDPPEAPPLVFQHNYLGNLTDVQSGTIAPHLQSGQVYDLPVLPLEGVVMVPGTTVPLSVNLHGRVLRLALDAPGELRNLLTVVCAAPTRMAGITRCARVGCIMELTQQTQDAEQRDDTCYLARGLRRVSLGGANGFGGRQPLVPCTVLPPESPLAMPREAADERCHLPAWACRMYDCNTLAHEVCEVLQHVAPSMQPTEVDPLQLSYWLLRTLPLECAARQNLLEMDCVAQRLQAELDVLRGMSSLYCILCRYEVGKLADAISLTEAGAAGIFINPHGYVHDMVTLHRVGRLALEGNPEPRDSWFPGYAWTIANCPTCSGHLGWQFSAVGASAGPAVFWGLRRSRLANSPLFEEQQVNQPWL